MSRLPLFWGAASDRDFSDELHRSDGSSEELVTWCQACQRQPATRTGLISARPLCFECGDVEADISVEQFAERWRRGVEIGQRLLARKVG